MILSDKRIKKLVDEVNMIDPFVPEMIREVDDKKILSYGLGSYGYDLRLSSEQFYVFRHIPGTIVNPKRFNPNNLELAQLHSDEDGDYFIIPAHSYGLGFALELLTVPRNVTAIHLGKSSYARIGIIANVTPAEASWFGHLTLEFSNSSSADARIYANEGVIQVLFLEGEECETSYNDRSGKYQGQGRQVTFAKV